MSLRPATPEETFTVTNYREAAASFPYVTTDEAAARTLWNDLYARNLKNETGAWTLTLWNNGLALEQASYDPDVR